MFVFHDHEQLNYFSLEITEDLYCMNAKTLLANKISSGEIINYNISG